MEGKSTGWPRTGSSPLYRSQHTQRPRCACLAASATPPAFCPSAARPGHAMAQAGRGSKLGRAASRGLKGAACSARTACPPLPHITLNTPTPGARTRLHHPQHVLVHCPGLRAQRVERTVHLAVRQRYGMRIRSSDSGYLLDPQAQQGSRPPRRAAQRCSRSPSGAAGRGRASAAGRGPRLARHGAAAAAASAAVLPK